MRRALVLLLAALAPAALAFTAAETRAIAAHGPWPPAFVPGPSNRASAKPEAIELGQRLFFERCLSAALVLALPPARAQLDFSVPWGAVIR